jgi:DNA-binding GntR family transcriptional regulator
MEAELHEHGALLEAIQAGDTPRLVQVLGDHIRRAGKDLVEDVTLAQSADRN